MVRLSIPMFWNDAKREHPGWKATGKIVIGVGIRIPMTHSLQRDSSLYSLMISRARESAYLKI